MNFGEVKALLRVVRYPLSSSNTGHICCAWTVLTTCLLHVSYPGRGDALWPLLGVLGLCSNCCVWAYLNASGPLLEDYTTMVWGRSRHALIVFDKAADKFSLNRCVHGMPSPGAYGSKPLILHPSCFLAKSRVQGVQDAPFET